MTHAQCNKSNKNSPKPRVLISACLGFSALRYDGSMLRDELVEKMKPYVEFIPLCPEESLGLGTPRNVLRLYWGEDVKKLYQKEKEQDLTEMMKDFTRKFLQDEKRSNHQGKCSLDGALLKNRSPSCARQDAKIYAEKSGQIPAGKSSGLFAQVLMEICPSLMVEDEGRLKNRHIREHFFTALFTLARFREIVQRKKRGALVNFHAQHKFLLMAFNEKKMREMGRLLAEQKQWGFSQLADEYHKQLNAAFQTEVRPAKMINVLMHIMGFFKSQLSTEEKEFFLDSLEKYRGGQLPLSVPLNILKSWALKYGEDYLLSQYVFTPFPDELMSLHDSGKQDF